MQSEARRRSEFERSLVSEVGESFDFWATCYPINRRVPLHVDFNFSWLSMDDSDMPLWRERLVCPVSHLNNRQRASVHLFDLEVPYDQNSNVLIVEHGTPLSKCFKEKIPQLVTSLYFSKDSVSGQLDEEGIRHEDLLDLSYSNEEVDIIMVFDVLEHLCEYRDAFREVQRILKKGGLVFWSAPFRRDSQQNVILAKYDDGELLHLKSPEYHFDPTTNQLDCLCFQHFGWEILDQIREVGFSDAYALSYWSDTFGYLGHEQFQFIAIK